MPDAPIPQTDPKAGYLAQRAAIDAAIRRVLESGWYILGEEVAAFEHEFAAFVGTAHAVAVASGTDALILGLRALGIGPGDAVATVSHTAVATVAAVELAGATPLLIDVDDCATMDPEGLSAALERMPRVKAVIPVHLYGQPAAMDAIRRLAEARGLAILEDCSQAHGATFAGAQVGTLGQAAAYSLYPTKNLGALGDGGILTTNDAVVAERLRALREYGWRERYVSDIAGYNSRLDPLQAGILRVKLAHLAADNARRQGIAAAYDAGLAGADVERPARRPNATHVFHQYVIQSPRRDALRAALKQAGVMTNIHYPVPVHLQPAYRGRVPLGPKGMARTEALAGRILSLPMYPQMTDAQVARVIAAVRAAAG